jgi:hypothetical protein
MNYESKNRLAPHHTGRHELGYETVVDGWFTAVSLTVEDQTDHPSPRIQNFWKERLETARQELSGKQ